MAQMQRERKQAVARLAPERPPRAEFPSYGEVRSALPAPALVEIRPGLRLETFHAPGALPALVFIHGGLGNLWDFYPQLYHFYGERELVAYTLAGNGESDDRKEHTLAGHVQDLADLLDTLAAAEPVVVGWSYGTELALEYAKQYQVKGVVLTGGGAFGLTPRLERPVMQLFVALRLYRFLPEQRNLMGVLKQLARWTAVYPETPEYVIEALLKANPLSRRRSAWKSVVDAFWDYDGRGDLDRIGAPTMVVHGPADDIVPIERAKETATLLPNALFVHLERTGHAVPIERYHTFNRLLEKFVAAIDGREAWPDAIVRVGRSREQPASV